MRPVPFGAMDADPFGVSFGFTDTQGRWQPADDAVRRELRAALGAPEDPDAVPADAGTFAIVTDPSSWRTDAAAELVLEDGTVLTLASGASAPADLPLGYHRVRRDGRPALSLVVAPTTCPAPPTDRQWGWAVQLYAARSRGSWGIGDLHDLDDISRWSSGEGAGFVLVNPLHAAAPGPGQQPSPYFPTSRVWRNPLYLRVEDVPGADAVPLDETRSIGHRLDRDRRIDRDAVWTIKRSALAEIWELFRRRSGTPEWTAFCDYRAEQGGPLEDFATWSALTERHGGSWTSWPEELRRPSSPAVARFRAANPAEVGFFAWLQWCLDLQLATVGSGPATLMTDLAIGVDRAGADAWAWQDTMLLTTSIGAPPDDFATLGQDWGLPPFDPWKLRAAAYEPFIRTVRASLRHAGALRMDHVMGLFRLWCIPEGRGAAQGAYVYLPYWDLLGIVALEATRAGAYVVGEDLGTVEPYVREQLASRRVLSYRLTQFEDRPTTELPETAMTAATTHDLATMAGLWTGTDLLGQARAGTRPNVDGTITMRHSLAARAGMEVPDGPAGLDALLEPVDATDATVVRALFRDPEGGNEVFARVGAALGMAVEEVTAALDRADAALRRGHQPRVAAFIEGVHRDLATAPSVLIAATLDDAVAVTERPNLPAPSTSGPTGASPCRSRSRTSSPTPAPPRSRPPCAGSDETGRVSERCQVLSSSRSRCGWPRPTPTWSRRRGQVASACSSTHRPIPARCSGASRTTGCGSSR